MAPFTRDGNYVSPFNICLEKISSQRACLDPVILDRIVHEFTAFIVGNLEKENARMQPLTMECAVNGAPLDPFIRRMNASTSAAFGNPGKKSLYLPIVYEDEKLLIREPVESIKLEILEIMEGYRSGVARGVVNKVQLKDEPREISKVIAGKTRPFYMSPLSYLILSRMYLAPFYSQMVENSSSFGCAVGVNMHSDARKLVDWLSSFGSSWLEGDYGAFDQLMPFDIGHAANTVVYRVLETFGYNGDALSIVKGLLTDALYPQIEVLNDLFEVPGLQPSGKYATAEDNSLRGVLIMMYNFYSIEVHRELLFFDCVRPVVYGDDMLAAVKPLVESSFNNLVYKDCCESLLNLTFTSPSKSGEMEKFVCVDTCTFLKRRFEFREDISEWVAPLDMNSLFKTLQWTLPSTVVAPSEQMKGAVISVLWEVAIAFPKNVFDRFKDGVKSILSRHYFLGEDVDLPTYDGIIDAVFCRETALRTQSRAWRA